MHYLSDKQMARKLSWYAMPRNVTHDDNAKLCFDWENEVDHCEMQDEIEAKLEQLNISSRDTMFEFTKGRLKHMVCPKCLLFAAGLNKSCFIKAIHTTSHSYISPMWDSPYCISNIFKGDWSTDFIRRFNRERIYYECLPENINKAYHNLRMLGIPLNVLDRSAYDESVEALAFIKHWLHKGMMVIYDVDY